MDIGTIASGAASGTASSRASIGETFDNFLNLLTTQLRYQDPVSPLDTNEFTNQLVQFSQVEQLIQSNDKLDALLTAEASSQIGFAASLTGRDVELRGDALAFDSATPVTFGYEMPAGTVDATIRIVDGRGTTVFTASAESGNGRHALAWDGRTDDGTIAAAGTYRIQLSGRDTEGAAVVGQTSVVRRVTGVDLTGGTLTLEFDGGGTARLSDIMAIREATPSAAS